MSVLNILIVAALLTTVAVMVMGIWSMQHGGESDQKRSTKLMFARVGMQGITFLLLLLAFFVAD